MDTEQREGREIEVEKGTFESKYSRSYLISRFKLSAKLAYLKISHLIDLGQRSDGKDIYMNNPSKTSSPTLLCIDLTNSPRHHSCSLHPALEVLASSSSSQIWLPSQ